MHYYHISKPTLSVLGSLLVLSGCGTPPGQAPLLPADGGATDTTNNTVDLAGIADADVVPDQFIVDMIPGADAADIQALFDEAQVNGLDRIENLSAWLVGFEPERREEVRSLLTGSPLVESVLENRLYYVEATTNDLRLGDEWHLATVQAPTAWDITLGSVSMPVAVVDTGVESTHPDLQGKVLPGTNLWQTNSDTSDVYGHGTMVAGVIAANANNNLGIAPMAWLNPILPVRVASDSGQSSSWVLASGVQYATTAGAKVINVSFAPLQNDSTFLRQCQLARLGGSLVVISSGNTGKETNGGGSDSALFVGATDTSDAKATFSTSGDFVAISAPGVSIVTTKINALYGAASGTSFAAPVVAGAAALVWSVNPSFRPVTVRNILLATVQDLGAPGKDNNFGAGRLNAAAAVQMAKGFVEVADHTSPTVSIRSPSDQAALSAPTAVSVSAADNDELADVTLYVDNQPLAADFSAPYQFLLNPNRFAPGAHLVKAVASDVSGNSATQTITVIFQGPPDVTRPTIHMINPANGSEVQGVITIRADVVDDRSVAVAEVLVDGGVIGSVPFQDAGVKVAFNWDSSTASVGPHSLSVRATDSSGNASTAGVTVTVKH